MKKALILLALPFALLFAKENLSLLSLEKNPYGLYLKTLMLEQNISEENIKKLLVEKRLSVKGSLIKALYFQYHKKNIKQASLYYDEVLKKVPHLVKNSSHSMYLADYLVIKDDFSEIKKILNINYCNTLLTEEFGKCAYYVFLSKKGSYEETFEERSILDLKENSFYRKKLELENEL